MAKKKYYKVVRNVRGRYYSAIMRKDNGLALTQYFTDRFTVTPKQALGYGYLLTCFGSKKSIFDWAGGEDKKWHKAYELWEVEVSGRVKRVLPTFCRWQDRNPWAGFAVVIYDDWPKGTIMAEKIKLVKRVK